MLSRLSLVALAACALFAAGPAAQASHPFEGSGQPPGDKNYLYSSLEVPAGAGKILYSLCGSPYGVPTEWRSGVENWDSPLTNWLFDEVSCGSGFHTKLQWEDALHVCGEGAWACWPWPQSGDYVVHGGHRDLKSNVKLILFDRNAWVNLPAPQNQWPDQWRLQMSAHEWGHNMSLADHESCNCAENTLMVNYWGCTMPAYPCYQSPTAADINSVRNNVYHLSAGVRVAAGDVDGDGCDEVITAPGPGLNPWVRVWDALSGPCITSSSGVFVRAQFLAYTDGFEGGVYVSAGNVDASTSRDEIITGAGAGGGPHVKAFSLNPSSNAITQVTGFFAYESNYTGGARVGAGDLVCGGAEELLTSPGATHTPRVRTWSFPSSLVDEFDAYSSFNEGVFVAGGNLTSAYCGDEITTGADAGGGPHVKAFCCASGDQIASFYAYTSGFTGGVRVGTGNYDSDTVKEIATAAGPGGGPHVKAFNLDGSQIEGFFAYPSGFTGGVFVAGGNVDYSTRDNIITGADAGGGPHVKVWQCCPADQQVGWMAWSY